MSAFVPVVNKYMLVLLSRKYMMHDKLSVRVCKSNSGKDFVLTFTIVVVVDKNTKKILKYLLLIIHILSKVVHGIYISIQYPIWDAHVMHDQTCRHNVACFVQ